MVATLCRDNLSLSAKGKRMFLSLRELWFTRGRFVLIGAVVALVGVLTVLLSGLATGLVDDGISGLRALPVTHLAFQPGAKATFSRSTVKQTMWQGWATEPGVQAAPLGSTIFNGRTAGGVAVDIAMFGIQPGSFIDPGAAAGRPIGAADDGIVVTQQLVDQGVHIGDTLTLEPVALQVRVVGTAARASYGHVPIAYASLALWQRATYGLASNGELSAGASQLASAVALRVPAATDVAAIDAKLGTESVTKSGAYAGSPGYSAETSTMTLIRGFLYVISALMVGAFFTVWTIQRTPEIGVLKALGASNRYVLRDALGQALLVMVAFVLVGTGIGVGLGMLVPGAVPFALRAQPVVLASLLLVATGLVGALIGVRRVTAVDPLLALGVRR